MLIAVNIRLIESKDRLDLKAIIDANELFPANMLDEMLYDYFSENNSHEIWLTGTVENKPVAIAYCAPEKMTEGTWNLYLIAVHPEYQGQGIGTAIIGHVEQMLISRGQRILLVETSGLDSFAKTRSFYKRCGYEEEARIREFYDVGEDKIVFRKSLV
ncbi:MAG: GNAT family N-acetyltransferase, partial [Cyanobacteria bacterium J06600_6]